MKIKNAYLALFALLALFMSSCTDDLKYAKMIPDDAYFVMRLDVKQTVEKCGLQENPKVKKSITDALKESDLSRDLRDRIETIFEKPATSGLDLRKPVFFYASKEDSDEETALVGALHSESDFADLINAVAKEVDSKQVKKTNDGVNYVEDGGSYIIFDDDWFYMGTIDYRKEAEEFANEVAKKMNGKDTPTFADTEEFKQMGTSGGVMQLIINGKGIDKIVKDENIKEIDEFFPKDVKLKDASYMFDLTMNNGEMALTGKILSSSDEWEKYIKDNDQKLGDVKGDLLKYISKEGLSIVANINGQQILDALKNAGFEDINNNNEIQKILTSINGDIALNITDVNMETQLPTLSAYVQTKDNTMASLAESALDGAAEKKGENDYLINGAKIGLSESGDFNAVFGYKDGATYVITGTSPTSFALSSGAFSLSDIKGKKAYVRLSFAALEKMAEREATKDAEILKKVLQKCDYAELYYEGGGKSVLRLVTKDKAKTPAASLIDLAYDFYDTFNNKIRTHKSYYAPEDIDTSDAI